MSSVDRIRAYIDFHKIKKSEFYLKTGLSNGYLDKVKELGADKILSIISAYPDIDLTWIITGIETKKEALAPHTNDNNTGNSDQNKDIPPPEKAPFVTENVTPPVTPTHKNHDKTPLYTAGSYSKSTHILNERHEQYGLNDHLTDKERITRLESLLKGIQDLLNEQFP